MTEVPSAIEVPFAAAAASSSVHSFAPFELEGVSAVGVEVVVVAVIETVVSVVEATFAVVGVSDSAVGLVASVVDLPVAAIQSSGEDQQHQVRRPYVSQTADVPYCREIVDHQQQMTLAIFDE